MSEITIWKFISCILYIIIRKRRSVKVDSTLPSADTYSVHPELDYDDTLQWKSHLCTPRKEIARPQSQFSHSCACERFIYSQEWVHRCIFLHRKGRPIVGIYKSLTDTWMWKLGLRLRNSFSWNICFKFSVLCLYSVVSALMDMALALVSRSCKGWTLFGRRF